MKTETATKTTIHEQIQRIIAGSIHSGAEAEERCLARLTEIADMLNGQGEYAADGRQQAPVACRKCGKPTHRHWLSVTLGTCYTCQLSAS